jgi:hypothetical protein
MYTAQFSEMNYTAFLSAFVKLGNTILSVGMSVCPHRTTWLPLDRFPLNFIVDDFSKICPENSSLIKI